MFISKLEIKNFKSIKTLSLEPSQLCAIIGPNSTGKTNVLKAIDLVLGEGWTTKAKVAKELFHDTEADVEIKITFDEAITFTGARGRDISVSSIELAMSLHPDLQARTTINGGDTFYDQEKFKKLCHFIYIPSERSLNSELRVSQWTMLGKLMRQIYEAYVSSYDEDENKLKEAFEEKMIPAKEFLESDFSNGANTITFKKFSDVFKKNCLLNSAGLANEFQPVLNIYNVNWFYKTLQIQVKEDLPNKHFESEEVGAGMQTLIMISIFQTYAELMGKRVIFGVEEPEIYLYPQAQRTLYRNFIDLSENTQIFYTTHNPNFVDAARPDDMLLLRKTVDLGAFKLEKNSYFNSVNAEKHKYKIYTHFNPERNEIFFARKVVLVEGDSDKILFTTLCEEKWGVDIDKLGVSIISCGGKSGVNYFVGICSLIGLQDFFAVWDEDDNTFSPEINYLPDALKNGHGLEVPGNLEKFLGLPTSNDSDKVENAFKWASSTSISDIPDPFSQIKKFIGENSPDTDSDSILKVEELKIKVEASDVNHSEVDADDIPF